MKGYMHSSNSVYIFSLCRFLHNEIMFAVSHGKHTYVYNKDGVEIHCLKPHDNADMLEFLPYHFLLVSYVPIYASFISIEP